MKLHSRTMVVSQADLEFRTLLRALTEKYDLTFGETIKILSEYLSTEATYMIREERHPEDPGKKGDEE